VFVYINTRHAAAAAAAITAENLVLLTDKEVRSLW